MEALGGRIFLVSPRGEGTDLRIELPLAATNSGVASDLELTVFAFSHAAGAFRAVDEGIPGLMHAVLDYDRIAATWPSC